MQARNKTERKKRIKKIAYFELKAMGFYFNRHLIDEPKHNVRTHSTLTRFMKASGYLNEVRNKKDVEEKFYQNLINLSKKHGWEADFDAKESRQLQYLLSK